MMDWTLMVAVIALWDIVRTLAVVMFTAWYTAKKVNENGEGKTKQEDKGEEAALVDKR